MGDVEFDLGLGSAGEDADEGGFFFSGLVDFEVDGAGGSGLDAGAAVVEDAAEFRGSAGDGEVGLGVFEDVGVAVLPGADLVLDAGAEGFRVERAAVEEDGIDGREVAEEIGQIAGDGAVGGVGQAPFLERGVGLDRAGVGGALGVEAVEQDGGDFVAGDAGGEGAGEEAGAAAGEGNGEFLGGVAVGGEAAFFQIAATGDEVLPLAASQRFAFAGEAGFEGVGDGEIDIVAAEQEVIADGDAADGGKRGAGLAGDFEEAEVGCAAADVDDEDVAAVFGELGPEGGGVGVGFEPAVEGGLGFFEEADVFGESGFGGGVEGEALGDGVERGGDGDGDFLGVEGGIGETGVPCAAEVVEEEGGGADGGDFLVVRDFLGGPREEGGGAVHGVVAEPGFGGMGDAAGSLAGAFAGEAAAEPIASPDCGRLELGGLPRRSGGRGRTGGWWTRRGGRGIPIGGWGRPG